MEKNFPMASKEELCKNSDDCPICWDKMETGRKLPCGHLFHNYCLRSWLEQDTSCPTCRKSLRNHQIESPRDLSPTAAAGELTFMRTSRLHFDGPRYSRWLPIRLPSVQIEVGRGALPPERPNLGNQENTLNFESQRAFSLEIATTSRSSSTASSASTSSTSSDSSSGEGSSSNSD